MRLSRILTAEIMFRRVSFCIGCVSVGLAVAAAAGSVALLRGHDLRTERVVELKEAQTRADMAKMEDDYRRIMKRMGYNLMILNKAQDAGKLLEQGYPETTIPESDAERLAAAGLDSLNHLLPVLQKRVTWPETGESILLTGIRGQMHLAGPRSSRSPIMAPVPDGRVALGRALSRKVNVAAAK